MQEKNFLNDIASQFSSGESSIVDFSFPFLDLDSVKITTRNPKKLKSKGELIDRRGSPFNRNRPPQWKMRYPTVGT